ncbi:double-stranded RNA-specific editase Adar-like [Centruroides sculpturatus]|uniref:double-stranded RNA-specific editase Adar-like n=1 Tax=Centruroides sculpturatus TaxID=218467 RepID=UPI000C6CACD8|nr:double-stranded RNA-specific editase Adar-like [Centruroides sculpturatus]
MEAGDGFDINSTELLKRKDISSLDGRSEAPTGSRGNASRLLNELKPDFQFTTEMEGPAHRPTFTVTIKIDNKEFTGQGHSKQMAKHAATENALAAFGYVRNSTDIPNKNVDYFDRVRLLRSQTDKMSSEYSEEMDWVVTNTDSKGRNPVALLYELHPDLKFNLIEEKESVILERFRMSVEIADTIFQGSGRSKKLAKAAAAESALYALYGINFSKNNTNRQPLPEKYVLLYSVANRICGGIGETFRKVTGYYAERNVLAGIAMTRDSEMEIIAVCAGTKDDVGKDVSLDGTSLNDCHAEVLVRRCLTSFLYSQLESMATGRKNRSIFIECDGTPAYRLKPDVKFHLYVSEPPCGDARMCFPEEFSGRSLQRGAYGVLRWKNKFQKESFYIESNDGIQTVEVIKRNKRQFTTLSCSDKIASWNVLGIQGSLLSHFIQPIYLESIIIGREIYPGYIFRAMWGRFEKSLQILPEPYRLRKPKICWVKEPEYYHSSNLPDSVVNWSVEFKTPEIINPSTGKLPGGNISRLSKAALFYRFRNLCDRVPNVSDGRSNGNPESYLDWKRSSLDHQAAKKILKEAFQNAGLGTWVTKRSHPDDFVLSF